MWPFDPVLLLLRVESQSTCRGWSTTETSTSGTWREIRRYIYIIHPTPLVNSTFVLAHIVIMNPFWMWARYILLILQMHWMLQRCVMGAASHRFEFVTIHVWFEFAKNEILTFESPPTTRPRLRKAKVCLQHLHLSGHKCLWVIMRSTQLLIIHVIPTAVYIKLRIAGGFQDDDEYSWSTQYL